MSMELIGYEGLGAIRTQMGQEDLLATRMHLQELGDVIDSSRDGYPGILLLIMLLYLVDIVVDFFGHGEGGGGGVMKLIGFG